MRTIAPILLLMLCSSGIGQSAQDRQAARRGWLLRYDGVGTVSIGMTLKQLNAALGENFSAPEDEDEQKCFYVEPKRHPDTTIMVLNGRVGRVDVFKPEKAQSTTATAEGIRIGDSEIRVKKVYAGKVAVEAHHYDPAGHYLYIRSGDYALRFETDGNKVTSFYAGTLPAVSFVEGCS